jgi:hypothetical protein
MRGYLYAEVHVLTSTGVPTDAAEAFSVLANIVRKWREQDLITTSAGLKPAFMTDTGGVTERDFGFDTWREFIEAGVRDGYLRTERLPSGHVVVMLPEESFETVLASVRTASAARDSRTGSLGTGSGVRLRADVWTTFVEWNDHARRLWDSGASRAYIYPVDEHGEPAWTSAPDRFTPIEPIDAQTQREWMGEWAATLPPVNREPLLAALDRPGVTGTFRRELNARGLTATWRDELQRRVANHVRAWADQHGIAWFDLIDRREREQPSLRPRATAAIPSESAEHPGSSSVRAAIETRPNNAPEQPRPANAQEQLRALLHRIIDQMSLAELLSIPIRAEYLLGDR